MKSPLVRTSMADNNTPPSSSVPSSSSSSSSSSSVIRFLGLLKQPDSDPTPFELDESDVLWSTSDSSTAPFSSPAKSMFPIPSSTLRHAAFCSEKLGLSAALPGNGSQRRKPRALNPSSTTAADAGVDRSAPVDVPVWKKGSSELWYQEGEGRGEEMVPPHEIVARSQMTKFSVFEGLGRTLKGRDLRRVRNAVWQKTGFLE